VAACPGFNTKTRAYFAYPQKKTPERTATERAMENIRVARKTTLEVGDVRREVLELQRQNRELGNDLDALKKKLDAGASATKPKRQCV